MMGNYHVRFLGGKGAERPLTYPVLKEYILILTNEDHTIL
jgi:hypothetical protein